jgi:hypothetical protein
MTTTVKDPQYATARFHAYPSQRESKHNQPADTWRAYEQHGLVYRNCRIKIQHLHGPIIHTATVENITHLSPNLVALHLTSSSSECPTRLIVSRQRQILPIPFSHIEATLYPNRDPEIDPQDECRKTKHIMGYTLKTT